MTLFSKLFCKPKEMMIIADNYIFRVTNTWGGSQSSLYSSKQYASTPTLLAILTSYLSNAAGNLVKCLLLAAIRLIHIVEKDVKQRMVENVLLHAGYQSLPKIVHPSALSNNKSLLNCVPTIKQYIVRAMSQIRTDMECQFHGKIPVTFFGVEKVESSEIKLCLEGAGLQGTWWGSGRGRPSTSANIHS